MCSIAIVVMAVQNLRLWTASLLASKLMNEFASTTESACNAKNPGVLSSLLNLYQFVVDCFSVLQLPRKENSGVLTSLLDICVDLSATSLKFDLCQAIAFWFCQYVGCLYRKVSQILENRSSRGTLCGENYSRIFLERGPAGM
jgi:hypothetical protein